MLVALKCCYYNKFLVLTLTPELVRTTCVSGHSGFFHLSYSIGKLYSVKGDKIALLKANIYV